MPDILQFHKWKDNQISVDSELHKVQRYLRPRDWYYEAYGKYCNKMRKLSLLANETGSNQGISRDARSLTDISAP